MHPVHPSCSKNSFLERWSVEILQSAKKRNLREEPQQLLGIYVMGNITGNITGMHYKCTYPRTVTGNKIGNRTEIH